MALAITSEAFALRGSANPRPHTAHPSFKSVRQLPTQHEATPMDFSLAHHTTFNRGEQNKAARHFKAHRHFITTGDTA